MAASQVLVYQYNGNNIATNLAKRWRSNEKQISFIYVSAAQKSFWKF